MAVYFQSSTPLWARLTLHSVYRLLYTVDSKLCDCESSIGCLVTSDNTANQLPWIIDAHRWPTAKVHEAAMLCHQHLFLVSVCFSHMLSTVAATMRERGMQLFVYSKASPSLPFLLPPIHGVRHTLGMCGKKDNRK